MFGLRHCLSNCLVTIVVTCVEFSYFCSFHLHSCMDDDCLVCSILLSWFGNDHDLDNLPCDQISLKLVLLIFRKSWVIALFFTLGSTA